MSALGKKVLLIKPDYRYFPIGFGYIVSALNRHGIEFDFIDAFLEPKIDFERVLRAGDYCAVATGGLIGSYTFMKNTFEAVKSIAPDMPCILGGNITIDVNSKLLLSCIPADYLVAGEGELTFPELLMALDKKADPRYISGLVFKDETGLLVKTGRRAAIDLVNDNWVPVWSFFDIKKYGFGTMPVMTGRGCTGRCTFCSPTNGSFRARPIEHIIGEIEHLNASYDFAHFVFMNEIIFPDEATIRRFCEEYKKVKPFKFWHCLMRMDVNPDVLPVMRDAGCTLMNVGVESGSNRVLQTVKKDLTIDETRSFVQAAKKAGIPLQASFLTAHYDEQAEDIAQTVDLMLELKVSGPMAMTINYPGTRNYGMAKKRGLIADERKYIEMLDNLYSKNYYQVISGCLSGNLEYLNLSAMPDKELYKAIEREMRRYFTDGFKIEQAVVKTSDTEWRIDLSGVCPFCDGEISLVVNQHVPHPFALRASCPRCGENDIYFDPFLVDTYREYYDSAKTMLSEGKRLAIVGVWNEIRMFFMYDHYKINYDSIVGVVAHDNLREGFALNTPILAVDKLIDLNSDVLVVVSDIPVPAKRAILGNTRGWEPKLFFFSPYQRSRFRDVVKGLTQDGVEIPAGLLAQLA